MLCECLVHVDVGLVLFHFIKHPLLLQCGFDCMYSFLELGQVYSDSQVQRIFLLQKCPMHTSNHAIPGNRFNADTRQHIVLDLTGRSWHFTWIGWIDLMPGSLYTLFDDVGLFWI